MKHGGVGDAFEQVDAIDDGNQQIVGVGTKLIFGIGRMNLVKEPVKTLPLLSGDFLAHLARVFPGAIDAVCDGGTVVAVEDEPARHCIEIAVPLKVGRIAK